MLPLLPAEFFFLSCSSASLLCNAFNRLAANPESQAELNKKKRNEKY
jgi:hypothetical protein